MAPPQAAAQDDGWRTMFDYGFWILDYGLWIFNYFFFHPQSIIQHPSSFQAQLRPGCYAGCLIVDFQFFSWVVLMILVNSLTID